MEHVFQRQVIRGGRLDTILLEMELVDDHRLQQYLSLATGLPPQGSDSRTSSPDELRAICNEDMAKKYQVVPAKHESGALSVLVCDPVDVGTLENLADELDMSVQPMVVPEYQFRMSFAEVFGGEADERFSKLAAKRSTEPVSAAAKQVPTVTIGDAPVAEDDVDADDEGSAVAAASESEPQPAPEDTIPDLEAVPKAIEPEATQPADTSERVRGTRAPAEQPERRHTMEMNTDTLREHMRANAATDASAASDADLQATTQGDAPAPTEPETTPDTDTPANIAAPESVAGVPAAVAAEGAPSTTSETPEYNSISPDEARSLLSNCDDRDEIFVILLRAMRKRARHASLFTIKGTNAIGRVALSKAGIDNEDIRKITIPLNVPSRFQQVFDSKAFSVGPLDCEDESLKEALCALGGGEVPTSALLLPIVMRDRLIAIAVGHNRDKGISVGRVTELLPLGTATADAVSRLLAKLRAAKSQPTKTPEAAPQAEGKKTEIMMVPPVHVDNAASEDKVPAPSSESSATLPVADEAMLELFARIEDEDGKTSRAAMAEAMKQIDAVVTHLEFGFPGRLAHPRDEKGERLRAAEHGPILDLVTQIGPKCGPALAEKMRDADREIRYYATLCAAELRPADVINQLVERLFDGDEHIRALAVEALEGYPGNELHAALEFARKALHSEDNLRLKLAADGLVKLADTSAIPDLIDAHSRGGDAAEVSRSALFLLTNQDLGNSNRKWRSWWEKHEGTHRIEWMLEGLSHKNAEIRKNASETLRSLTGEFFGYGHDLPKKERDKTRKLWQDWWEETGKSRFE